MQKRNLRTTLAGIILAGGLALTGTAAASAVVVQPPHPTATHFDYKYVAVKVTNPASQVVVGDVLVFFTNKGLHHSADGVLWQRYATVGHPAG